MSTIKIWVIFLTQLPSGRILKIYVNPLFFSSFQTVKLISNKQNRGWHVLCYMVRQTQFLYLIIEGETYGTSTADKKA